MVIVDTQNDRTVAVELHHPMLGLPVTFLGHDERSAREIAWRRAMRDRLAGFRITLTSAGWPEPQLIPTAEMDAALAIPTP